MRGDVGWLIGWVDLCLIVLCDIGSNWIDLGLMYWGFLFLECNVNFYFSKWESMVLIWKMGTGLVICFCNLSQNTWFAYIFSFGLVWASERSIYVMARRRKWTNREHGKKLFGESEQAIVHGVCI